MSTTPRLSGLIDAVYPGISSMSTAPLECPGTDNGEYVICRRDQIGKRRTLAHVYDADLAALIVRAVNAYDAITAQNKAMREALTDAIETLLDAGYHNNHPTIRNGKVALTLGEK